MTAFSRMESLAILVDFALEKDEREDRAIAPRQSSWISQTDFEILWHVHHLPSVRYNLHYAELRDYDVMKAAVSSRFKEAS